MAGQVGLSFKETVEALASFLEVTLHTILYLRQIYPPTTFSRRRAHGVPVYQSRHPQVREYIAEIVSLLSKELANGNLKRVSVVVKSAASGLALERFLVDVGYGLVQPDGPGRDVGIMGAPGADELSLMLRGFLIRLTSLDGQLEDNRGEYLGASAFEEATFAVVVETKDGLEPASNAAADGGPVPWIPALASDTLHPPPDPDTAANAGAVARDDAETCPNKHEPLLHVKAVETGVIDLRLMVQECFAKTGVQQLQAVKRD